MIEWTHPWVNMILYSNSPTFQHSTDFSLIRVSFNAAFRLIVGGKEW
jgi:hypothetical protein